MANKQIIFASHCVTNYNCHFHGHGFPLGMPCIKQIVGDGNCFFLAVTDVVTGSEQFHSIVRRTMSLHLNPQ